MTGTILSPNEITSETHPSDFVYGAEEIARFMGITVRKVYYFMERRKLGKGHVPIKNLPSIGLCASRKALVDYLNGQRQV